MGIPIPIDLDYVTKVNPYIMFQLSKKLLIICYLSGGYAISIPVSLYIWP